MKNKKLLITSGILFLIICAAIVGVLYFATDLLKTEQQLFYKYLAEIEIMDSDFIKQFNIANDKITGNSHSSSTNFSFSTGGQNKETGASEEQSRFSIASNGLLNVTTNQSYRDFTLSQSEQNLLTIRYMRDGNTFAIGADNILAKYLAVENANLKELFVKLGVEDASQVPDSIPTNYEEILKVDEQTLAKLKETYSLLIYNNIGKENFYKVKNADNTEIIGVSLTEKELNDLTILLLENVKNDNLLLELMVNKAKLVGINDISKELIQEKMQEYIEELQPDESYDVEEEWVGWKSISYSKYEKIEDKLIKIELVKKQKEIIGINLKESYTKQTRIYENYADDEYKTSQENIVEGIMIDLSKLNEIIVVAKENDTELFKSMLNYSYDNNNINLYIELESKEDGENSLLKIQYQVNNLQTDNINQKCAIDVESNNEGNYKISLLNNIALKQDVIISKLTTENSAKLNNMTSEELEQLFIALGNRITTLYGNEFIQ